MPGKLWALSRPNVIQTPNSEGIISLACLWLNYLQYVFICVASCFKDWCMKDAAVQTALIYFLNSSNEMPRMLLCKMDMWRMLLCKKDMWRMLLLKRKRMLLIPCFCACKGDWEGRFCVNWILISTISESDRNLKTAFVEEGYVKDAFVYRNELLRTLLCNLLYYPKRTRAADDGLLMGNGRG